MKKLLLIIVLMHFVIDAISQNLVPDPSFEDTNCCPQFSGQLNCVKNWTNPNLGFGDPDYWNTCGATWCGSLFARTGNGYVGIFVYSGGGNLREYIEARLLDSLKPNKKYCFQMYVHLCPYSKYATDDIGAFFSPDSVGSPTPYLALQPQIENTQGNVIMDTANWVLISGSFIATGGEKYITIGNFKNDVNTTLDSTSWGMDARSYYLIDDVSLVCCDVNNCETINSLFVPTAFSPNGDGNNDILFVRGENIKTLNFTVYDRWGEKVFETQDINQGWDGKYKDEKLNNSVFVYYLSGTYIDGKTFSQKGDISLIR